MHYDVHATSQRQPSEHAQRRPPCGLLGHVPRRGAWEALWHCSQRPRRHRATSDDVIWHEQLSLPPLTCRTLGTSGSLRSKWRGLRRCRTTRSYRSNVLKRDWHISRGVNKEVEVGIHASQGGQSQDSRRRTRRRRTRARSCRRTRAKSCRRTRARTRRRTRRRRRGKNNGGGRA